MRKLFVPIVIVLLAPMALANVWTTVYRCDEKTPLAAVDPNHPAVYRDIMVGARLVLVVSSDKAQYWWGGLLLSQDDAPYATLSGRDCAPPDPGNLEECRGSCLPAAGKSAKATPMSDPWNVGLDLNSGRASGKTHPEDWAAAGDWFVIDYRAQRAGTCTVGLYDYSLSFDEPIATLAFTHVPSRDMNQDATVNLNDFALLASHWGADADPNSPDAVFDLNQDKRVDLGDLAQFSAYWLEQTDCAKTATDPNEPKI